MSELTLYYFPTPNGRKISIALEEMGLDYRIKLVNIFNREAQQPDYLAICPNGRIPALVDEAGAEPVVVFESGAILLYLARKTGLFCAPQRPALQAQIESWLFWQMASLGPMTGQITWFTRAAQKPGRPAADTSLALHRFTKEVKRLYEVLNRQLTERAYLCGEYSIADIACWPWIDQHHNYIGELQAYPHIADWHRRIGLRPAVQRSLQLGLEEARRALDNPANKPSGA